MGGGGGGWGATEIGGGGVGVGVVEENGWASETELPSEQWRVCDPSRMMKMQSSALLMSQ